MEGREFFDSCVPPADYFDYYSFNRPSNSTSQLIANAICKEDPLFKGETFVDIGSGPGNSIELLYAKFNFNKCIAIDGSSSMLSYLAEIINPDAINIQLQCKDLRKDCFDIQTGSTDLCAASYVVSYLSDIKTLFKEVSRVLKSGGYWGYDIITHQAPCDQLSFEEDYGGISVSGYAYSENYLKELYEFNGFSLVEITQKKGWRLNVERTDTKSNVYVLKKI